MEFFDLLYRLRKEMFNRYQNLTTQQETHCYVLAIIICSKICNSDNYCGSEELVRELHLLKCAEELFSEVPINDNEIVQIIDTCYKKVR